MKGKTRCRILKDIRRRIAEENGIEFVTSECKYKSDCRGTCPKCESEVRYLESELERKRSLGYKITVAGIAAGITLASAGCTPEVDGTDSSVPEFAGAPPKEYSLYETQGDIAVSDITEESTENDETSEPVNSENSEEEDGLELMGEMSVEVMGDIQ